MIFEYSYSKGDIMSRVKLPEEEVRKNCIMIRLDDYEMDEIINKTSHSMPLARCLREDILKCYDIPLNGMKRMFGGEHSAF